MGIWVAAGRSRRVCRRHRRAVACRQRANHRSPGAVRASAADALHSYLRWCARADAVDGLTLIDSACKCWSGARVMTVVARVASGPERRSAGRSWRGRSAGRRRLVVLRPMACRAPQGCPGRRLAQAVHATTRAPARDWPCGWRWPTSRSAGFMWSISICAAAGG